MAEPVLLSLKIYALAIVISMAVALLIKLIVVVVSVRKPGAERVAQRAPAAAASPPAEHVAAIAAAVYACLGAHRIVHIAERHRGHAWTTEGRTAHHASHNVPHHPHR